MSTKTVLNRFLLTAKKRVTYTCQKGEVYTKEL